MGPETRKRRISESVTERSFDQGIDNMGWDRKGEYAYYSRSHRENGKIKRQYIPLSLATTVARMDEYRRSARKSDSKLILDLKLHVRLDLAEIDSMITATDSLLLEIAESAGYYRHDRGAWRKRRRNSMCDEQRSTNEEITTPGNDKIMQLTAILSEIETSDTMRLGDLVASADSVTAVPLYLMPSFITLKYVGRLEEHSDNLAAMLSRDLAKLRSDLQYESSPTLERLMIDRVCCCFVAYYCTELQVAGLNSESRTFAIHDDHTERVARRLERSIKVLAQVRRMRLPEIHVNLVDKQLNVIQSSHDPLTTKSA